MKNTGKIILQKIHSFIKNNEKILGGIIFIDNISVLNSFTTRINQDIKFVDIDTWKVFEHFTINNEKMLNQLGFFDSFFQYKLVSKTPFLDRRNDFQGYKMVAITAEIGPYIVFNDFANAQLNEGTQLFNTALYSSNYSLTS